MYKCVPFFIFFLYSCLCYAESPTLFDAEKPQARGQMLKVPVKAAEKVEKKSKTEPKEPLPVVTDDEEDELENSGDDDFENRSYPEDENTP